MKVLKKYLKMLRKQSEFSNGFVLLSSQGCHEYQWKWMWKIFCLLHDVLAISINKKSNNNIAI